MNLLEKERWLFEHAIRFNMFLDTDDGMYKGSWKAAHNRRIVVGQFTCSRNTKRELIETMFDDVKEYLYMIINDMEKKLYDARRHI